MAHGIDNNTLLHIPVDLSDPIALRNTLLLMIQQIDLIIGNRVVTVDHSATKVAPSAAYVQAEAVSIADDVYDVHKRLETLEARLVPVNN